MEDKVNYVIKGITDMRYFLPNEEEMEYASLN